ncbi:MAG TPA: hypothetical protein VEK15_01405 [Vicinamibacteria bacterium]|nr:hypothetical protein [Vicinamibacteria bacterium]
MKPRSFIPRDTDPEANEIQTRAYRRMGGVGRIAVMFRLTAMTKRNAAAGIRERHPDYDEERVRVALCRLLFGDELTRRVFGIRKLPVP